MSNPAPVTPATNSATNTDPATPPAVVEGAPPEGTTPPAKVLTTEELLEANRSKNAEARNLRERLRVAEEELGGFRTAAEALKPEEQREAERVAALETTNQELANKLAALERGALIAKVQAATKLPDALAELLQGADEAELTAHATKLAALIPPAVADPVTPPPRVNPGQTIPSGAVAPTDRQAAAKAWLSTVPGLSL